MILRRATLEDSDFLFALRNDPQTVKASFDDRLVTLDEHSEWMKKKLSDPFCELYIAEEEIKGRPPGNRVGMGRLELNLTDAELSIAVSPEYRRRGFGSEIIKLLLARSSALGKFPLARIRSTNISSLKAFLNAGMRPKEGIATFVWFTPLT
jgi:RimJ/RimL family protein N-acetyltransferase